ncbi:MAG: glycerophosphodiester phosphodiesterase [Chitinophagaceae bacterium]|nr:glycerophosphodiester phosphodiesterase [Chitinophagaceae bacterium]
MQPGRLIAQLPEFDKQGHRGCRGLMPENTIPAMIRAIDLGVTTLEMDVVFTSDDKAVLSHEPFFNHDITTKSDGGFITSREEKGFNIYRMTYAETQAFDVGMKPNPRFPKQTKLKATKPLLSDVIDAVENYVHSKNLTPVFYNIETKTRSSTDNVFHPEPARFVDLLMGVITKKNIKERVVIQSFDVRTLQYLHKNYPEIKTSLLIERFDKYSVRQKVALLGFVPTVLSPESGMVNVSLVEYAHANGMKIVPWTVNTRDGIKRLKDLKVDGIITDYPDLF